MRNEKRFPRDPGVGVLGSVETRAVWAWASNLRLDYHWAA